MEINHDTITGIILKTVHHAEYAIDKPIHCNVVIKEMFPLGFYYGDEVSKATQYLIDNNFIFINPSGFLRCTRKGGDEINYLDA